MTQLFVPVLNVSDLIVCKEDGVFELKATETSGISGSPQVSWTKDEELLIGESSATLEVTETGQYKVTMTNGICDSEERDDQTVASITVQDLSVDFGVSSIDVDKGTEVVFTAIVDDEIGELTYQWQGEEQGAIATTNSQEYIYLADTADIVFVLVTDLQTTCEAESNHELVNVLLPIDAPNAFTPNGDGINETWRIEGLSTYRNSVMRIYNRWGQLVYSNNGVYNNDWDGRRNGKDLPTGTYYYVITLNQDSKTNISGDVSIIR